MALKTLKKALIRNENGDKSNRRSTSIANLRMKAKQHETKLFESGDNLDENGEEDNAETKEQNGETTINQGKRRRP